jgi:flavin-dependent dehydrogenase
VNRPVAIAGSGLAGMAAAINLAKAGLDVEITEMRSDAGARFHGDFEFFENWSREEDVIDSLRRMNLDIDFPVFPVRSGTAWDDRRRRYALQSDRPVMYMVRRGRFVDCLDSHLKKQALSCGVRIRFNTRADTARADIVATGPQPSRSLIYVLGASFDTDLEDDIRVILDPAIAPGVYAYLVAHEGKAIVCTAYVKHHRRAKTGGAFMADTLDAFQTTGRFDIRNVSYFGSFGISPLITRHSLIVVGEAAGFQDAVWGFGMRMAVQSGYLAARALISGEDYWDHVGKEIVPLVASTAVNRLAIDLIDRYAGRVLLRVLHRSTDRVEVLKRCYHPYGWKKLAFPLALRYCRGRQQAKPPR